MKRKPVNSSRVPVYRDAGFELYNADITSEAFTLESQNERDPDIYIYSRYRNPTVVAAEEEIMRLESSSWALLTQSGMSAIDVAVSVFQKADKVRPWLFFSEIYGGTISFTEEVLKKRRGLDIQSFYPDNERFETRPFESLVERMKPEFIYLEAISNPMLIVPEIKKLFKSAKANNCRIIVDNTFATPLLWKPLQDGADIVIHSATKYLSGHGNITAGVLCGNDPDLMEKAVEYRKFTGHMLSGDDAYRLTTQIQTFPLRFAQQCKNALRIAELLEKSEVISKVWYPGLKKHPTHKEAEMLFGKKGWGGIVTFDFKGNNPSEKRSRRDSFIKVVSDKIKVIPSLGDPKTIILPVEPVWGAKYPEPGMLRLSSGFEDTDEIISIINKALKLV